MVLTDLNDVGILENALYRFYVVSGGSTLNYTQGEFIK